MQGSNIQSRPDLPAIAAAKTPGQRRPLPKSVSTWVNSGPRGPWAAQEAPTGVPGGSGHRARRSGRTVPVPGTAGDPAEAEAEPKPGLRPRALGGRAPASPGPPSSASAGQGAPGAEGAAPQGGAARARLRVRQGRWDPGSSRRQRAGAWRRFRGWTARAEGSGPFHSLPFPALPCPALPVLGWTQGERRGSRGQGAGRGVRGAGRRARGGPHRGRRAAGRASGPCAGSAGPCRGRRRPGPRARSARTSPPRRGSPPWPRVPECSGGGAGRKRRGEARRGRPGRGRARGASGRRAERGARRPLRPQPRLRPARVAPASLGARSAVTGPASGVAAPARTGVASRSGRGPPPTTPTALPAAQGTLTRFSSEPKH